MKIFLKKVRGSYMNLFEARSYEGSEPRYSASYIMPPDHPSVAEIKNAITVVAKDKWGAKADAILKQLTAAGKTCLRDGDTKGGDGYEGNLFVSASSKKRPQVVDKDGKTPLTNDDGKPYSGCYVNAYIEIWAMDNQFGKRICASLGAVQFHGDGEAFGSGGSVGGEFENVEDEEELA